jgi:hypothetical protein
VRRPSVPARSVHHPLRQGFIHPAAPKNARQAWVIGSSTPRRTYALQPRCLSVGISPRCTPRVCGLTTSRNSRQKSTSSISNGTSRRQPSMPLQTNSGRH